MANSNEYMAKYMLDRYHRRRAEVVVLLGSTCAECGSAENLEIDHVDYSQKSFSIGKALAGWSWKRLEPEIKKCQLLCKDCHGEKTRKDLGKRFSQRERWEHGTISGYRHCKCSDCKRAKSDYNKKYYERNKPL